MNHPTSPWPCPICTELIEVNAQDCPHCKATAEWIDRIGALDFAFRRFGLWKLDGGIAKDQYAQLLSHYGDRRRDWVERESGAAVESDAGLPPKTACWNCQAALTPDAKRCAECNAPLNPSLVRLLRYQTFLCSEIRRLTEAGMLSKKQWQPFLDEPQERQIEYVARLDTGWIPPP